MYRRCFGEEQLGGVNFYLSFLVYTDQKGENNDGDIQMPDQVRAYKSLGFNNMITNRMLGELELPGDVQMGKTFFPAHLIHQPALGG